MPTTRDHAPDNEAVEDLSAEDAALDKMLAGSDAAGSTLAGAEAAGVVFDSAAEVCGISLRAMTLSDILLLYRMDNKMLSGETASVAEKVFATMEVLYIATRPSSEAALREWHKGPEAFAKAVELYAASLPWIDVVELWKATVAFLAQASVTRVSARAPHVSGSMSGGAAVEKND